MKDFYEEIQDHFQYVKNYVYGQNPTLCNCSVCTFV